MSPLEQARNNDAISARAAALLPRAEALVKSVHSREDFAFAESSDETSWQRNSGTETVISLSAAVERHNMLRYLARQYDGLANLWHRSPEEIEEVISEMERDG